MKIRLIVPALLFCIIGYGQQDQQQKISPIYKDTLGNIISSEAFEEKLKSGQYSASMSSKEGKVSLILVNKKKAEKLFAEQMNEFKKGLVNTKFPDFRLKKLDGSEISAKSLAGKTVVFNFWFIGCKPCVSEMPLLNGLVEQYKNRSDVVFLAPALDEQEKLVEFFNNHTFSYQVLSSAKEFVKKMKISSFPTHIIVDSKGLIQEVMIGGREDINKVLTEAIDKVLVK